MSEAAPAAAPAAPAVPPPPAPETPPPTAPAPPATPPGSAPAAPIGITSEQLKARLDEERTKAAERARADLLKEIGAESLDAAKTRVAKAKELEDQALSELQRRDKAIEDLRPKAQRAEALEAAVKRQSDAALASLTEAQRGAVQKLAGEDPVRVFDAIEALRPTWASPAAPPVPPGTTDPPKPAPLPAPGNTAPAATAPKPKTPESDNHLARYEQLLKEQPYQARVYRLQHSAAIEAALKAR